VNINRMEVNAAIERLLQGSQHWEEDAAAIISNCNQIPVRGKLVIEGSLSKRSDGESITGDTPGMGNVTLKDKPAEVRKEFLFGRTQERIGYFKVWKEADGVISFTHWWKADLTTQGLGQKPDQYFLGYDGKTLRPTYFAVKFERVVLNLILVTLSRIFLEPIYGEADVCAIGWVLR
jgi:hypothetical protein